MSSSRLHAGGRIWLAVSCLVVSTQAHADVGLPMVAAVVPGMIFGLVPIIALEGFVLRQALKLSIVRALKASALANLWSTLLGVPLTWVILYLLQVATTSVAGRAMDPPAPFWRILSVTIGAAWLFPVEGEVHWMIPAATLSLLVPFFFASWLTEYEVLWRYLYKSEGMHGAEVDSQIKLGALNANLASYSVLFILTASWLTYALLTRAAF